MSLQCIDCSKGQEETDRLKTLIWNQSKNARVSAATIFMQPTKDLKNEFSMTFDLGQIV